MFTKMQVAVFLFRWGKLFIAVRAYTTPGGIDLIETDSGQILKDFTQALYIDYC